MTVLCECGCGEPAPLAQRHDPRRGHVKGQPLRFVLGHQSAAVRMKISSAKRGHEVTTVTRAKISATLTGRTDPTKVRAKKLANATRGSDSPTWRGNDVGYNGVHTRARAILPRECARADATCSGRLEVSLRHDAPRDGLRVHDTKGAYYVGDDLTDGYWRLCSSHHARYDR